MEGLELLLFKKLELLQTVTEKKNKALWSCGDFTGLELYFSESGGCRKSIKTKNRSLVSVSGHEDPHDLLFAEIG